MYSFRLPALLLMMVSAFTLVCASPAKRQFDACASLCTIPDGQQPINFGTCATLDFNCLCKFQPFVQSVINCISTECSGSESDIVYTQLELRCLQAGVSTLPSATTPGITASFTRTIIDVPTSTATSTGTATLISSPPSSTTSRSSSARGLQRYSIPGLLATLAAVTLLI